MNPTVTAGELAREILTQTNGRSDATYIAALLVLIIACVLLIFVPRVLAANKESLNDYKGFLKEERDHRENIIRIHADSMKEVGTQCHQFQRELTADYRKLSADLSDNDRRTALILERVEKHLTKKENE